MSNNIYAALEIGTTRTVLAIGESQPDGRLRVICHASIPSTGVRKSQIIDLVEAHNSILSVLRETEKRQLEGNSRVNIGNAFLVVSGTHVQVSPLQGTAIVSNRRVTEADMNEAIRTAHSARVNEKREVLDILEQDWELDGRGSIPEPKGQSGELLRLNALLITGDADRISDARSAADRANLELRDPLFAATCAAEAAIDDYERQNGVLVLDLGGGCTGYAFYLDGYLQTAGVIGVGGDHVTNDIAHAFHTGNQTAEALKIAEASAVVSSSDAGERVKLPGDSPLMDGRTVSRRALNTVVNARMRELLTVLRERLDALDVLHRIRTGVVLTGGGAQLRGLDTLVSQTLGTDSVRKGNPINVDGLDETEHSESLSAIAGALLFAHRNYNEKSFLDNLKGLFGK